MTLIKHSWKPILGIRNALKRIIVVQIWPDNGTNFVVAYSEQLLVNNNVVAAFPDFHSDTIIPWENTYFFINFKGNVCLMRFLGPFFDMYG
jgi:hypothetical protein